jgi:hypothetical protein
MHHDDPCPPAATPGFGDRQVASHEPFVANALVRSQRGYECDRASRTPFFWLPEGSWGS